MTLTKKRVEHNKELERDIDLQKEKKPCARIHIYMYMVQFNNGQLQQKTFKDTKRCITTWALM